MSLLTGGRQRRDGASAGGASAGGASAGGAVPAGRASAGGAPARGASAGGATAAGRGTGRATVAVARNAVRVADAPLPGGGGAGLVHSRALDLAPLLALAASRPGLWLVAAGALVALGAAAVVALATGRLGPLARIDLAVVAATGLTVAARRVRDALSPAGGASARAERGRGGRRGR